MKTVKSNERPMITRGRLAAILGGFGVVAAIAAVFSFLSIPQDSVGDVAAIEGTLESATPGTASPTPNDDLAGDSAPMTLVEPEERFVVGPNEVGRLDELAQVTSVRPTRLLIEGISVDAPVEPYGINDQTGEMAVPSNVNDVGWYRYGPTPGEPGSAVLAAHVDLASRGAGVFFHLRDLQPGQEIIVEYDDGTSRTFIAQARATYDKDELPLDRVFSRGGSPVLTLITCGGGFSPSIQSYDSNVVVYAIPVEDVPDDPSLDTA